MGKDSKQKNVLSPKETAALLRQMADLVSGVGTEFEKDVQPSKGGFQKLKLSLKRARDSDNFVVKCKVKPEHGTDASQQAATEQKDPSQSVAKAADDLTPVTDPAPSETYDN